MRCSHHTRILFLLMLSLVLSACAGWLPAPQATTTPGPVATPTTTIAWFPATNTPTLLPTTVIFPTAEQRPGLGPAILSDQFEDPDLWTTRQGENNIVGIERGRITLTAQPKYATLSLRSGPLLTDFYAEIHARLSLCRGPDVYGLIFRAESPQDAYRFVVNCSGQARAERVRNGEIVPLHDWVPSGDAPAGAPGEVKLGVWVAGTEMRFFLNDRFQFSVCDPVFPFGTLGVYISSGGTTVTTVSFSDLNLWQISVASPNPSATASITPTP